MGLNNIEDKRNNVDNQSYESLPVTNLQEKCGLAITAEGLKNITPSQEGFILGLRRQQGQKKEFDFDSKEATTMLNQADIPLTFLGENVLSDAQKVFLVKLLIARQLFKTEGKEVGRDVTSMQDIVFDSARESNSQSDCAEVLARLLD